MAKRVNGEGSFSILKSGKVQMRKMVGMLPNGRPRIFTVSANSKSECHKLMNHKVETFKNNNYLEDDHIMKTITLAELCKLHLEQHIKEKDRLKPKASDRRYSTIKNQIEPYLIGGLQASVVNSMDVRNHIETLISEGKLSVSSITKTIDIINAAYKWAMNQKYLHSNPCDPVLDTLKNRLKKLKLRNSADGVVRVLSENQIRILERYVEEEKENCDLYKHIFSLSVLLLLYSGIRVGELCALKWYHWSEQSQTISIRRTRFVAKNYNAKEGESLYIPQEGVTKNYHSRTIALTPKAVAVLQEIRKISPQNKEDDYILINKRKNPSNPSNYDSNLNKLYKEVGFEDISGAHILRRTLATQMHKNSCRVEDIAAYLGDEPATIIKHYISLTETVIAEGEVLNVVKVPAPLF